ncbi:hypothetical protein AOQ84DRAFT_375709 [Glonium stellatum]|uniref:Uncharacterized protein n=1 Tax=Glonium stellatum TaxID=574774 RepID=A0A8E2F2W6_9PEZI|nr:hypothetical protein AOQ84DRAFT_375709 [Glonium stellatum]
MLSSRALAVLGAIFSITAVSVADPALGERAPFDAFGIVGKGYSGEAKAVDDYVADFAPDTMFGEKSSNETSPMIKDRSLELVGRQSCDAGYWYCDGMYIHSADAAQPRRSAAATGTASTQTERAARTHPATPGGAAAARSATRKAATAAQTTGTASRATSACGSSRAAASSAAPTSSAPPPS